MITEWTLTKILDRVEISQEQRNFNFNKQERINSKPVLQSGNENLQEYNCTLQLHVQFCNPKTIINILENRAESREPIEWIYKKEYKGMFVIDSLEKTVIKQIKDTVLYAEVNFNMIEYPQEEDFEQQIQGEADLSDIEKYSSKSNKLKDFAKKVKESVTKNLKETVMSGTISDNLSDSAKEIFSTVASDVVSDITGGNITAIYNTVQSYADKIEDISSFTFSDINELITAVASIPDTVMNTALRGNIND